MDESSFDTEDLIAWLLLNGDNFIEDSLSPDDKRPLSLDRVLLSPSESTLARSSNMDKLSIFEDFPSIESQHRFHTAVGNIVNNPDQYIGKSPREYDYTDDHDSDSSSEVDGSKRKVDSLHGDRLDLSSRKRSKTNQDDLERRLKDLETENSELRAHLSNLAQRNLDKQKQRSLMENLMGQIVNSQNGAIDFDSQSKLQDLLESYTETYADYGKSRTKEINFHLNQLEKLALPTTTTKMILWTLQQDKSFVTSPLFDEISANLGLNYEQTEKIQQRRQVIKDLIKKLRESLDLMKRLRTAISEKHQVLDSRLSAIKSIATSKQTVQFLFWIVKNSSKLQKLIPNFS